MARRTDIDWDLVETDYRVAQLSIRQIAEKHGVEASTITRRAKKDGWTRDLSESVRAATKAKVRAAIANSAQQITTECTQRVASEVELAASVGAAIVGRQQGRVGRLAVLMEHMTTELEIVTEDPISLADIAKKIEDDDPKAAEAIKRLKSTTTRINNLKTLSEINIRLRDAENDAFKLNDPNAGQSVDALLKSIAEEEGL